MLRLIAVLLLIPLLDIMLLLAVAGVIGGLETVLLVVLTALVGMLLARAEGRHTISKIQRKLARGEAPTDELIDGGLLIAAGAFLLTPGLVTDLVGLVLVVPLTRYPVRVALKKWVITPYVDTKTGGFATGQVYTAGFPGDGERADVTGQQTGEDTYDVGDDDYDIGDGDDNR
ncbi:FxsA family protein [Halapricum hydrolyticum]|uniref:Membrane protein FxsA n=1 Tax=Halapricum hydrolyticum TaxID=2979991 RepID=A0AAE3IBQ4_9EURY|nr:FxsA family protein [Halapricum hydrolyticum]MCU4718654.1 membrane protein FxsA [Halapricum hydrolyticum]MCU4727660.1 membrane protein FxsA [Halapricum hydrolyticum]